MSIESPNPVLSHNENDVNKDVRQSKQSELLRFQPEILTAEAWPVPKWLKHSSNPVFRSKRKAPNFETYYLHRLRTRYMELADEFFATYANYGKYPYVDQATARTIATTLYSARENLEQEDCDLLAVASALNMVDQYMVWLFAPEFVAIRARIVLSRLADQKLNVNNPLAARLSEMIEITPHQPFPLNTVRAILDELAGQINEKSLEDQISNGLQIDRLRALRPWGIRVTLLAVLLSPLVINPSLQPAVTWPLASVFKWDWGFADALIEGWIIGFTIATMGAIGGFLSGLLQARSSRITLLKYQENMLKLQLKPLIGALVAVVLYMFLSWKLLIGVSLENAGSFFVLSFLAGFSERFFLRLLEINRGDEEDQAVSASTTVAKVEQAGQTTTLVRSEEKAAGSNQE